MEEIKKKYPQKIVPEDRIFSHIHRGDRIFIGTGCGEPQYLVRALFNFLESHPGAFYETEVFQIWALGVATRMEEKFGRFFRHNYFFVGENIREVVNEGLADYTPVFLSKVPELFSRRIIPIDVALVQTSPPDERGYMTFGVSVDIVKSAVQHASLVVAQVNSHMPRVHGDGFIHLDEVDFIVLQDEPLLEFRTMEETEIVRRVGKYVAQLIQDGDTIQVGYGSLPNAILANLSEKQHLGVHTELLTDGIVDLMQKNVVDNSRKSINPGKTVATFCMGGKETYEYLDDNPAFEFRPVDYTNNPLVIALQDNMTAINSAIEIDLTGQATAESLGGTFYSGVGGQADFMRGAVLARNGKTILALPSTAQNGTVSRIVPRLKEGASVTLHKGDIHYVVTEYGIAYLHGKNIRERAMELIAISHPDFRAWLIEEAKKYNLIYKDQAYLPGRKSIYPEMFETYRATKAGLEIYLRPVKISDEPLLKDFFHAVSDESIYRRFISYQKILEHRYLQKFVVIDYTREMEILAIKKEAEKEVVVGIGQYIIEEAKHTAEVALVVRDDFQNKGIGGEMLFYLAHLAIKQGLLGFTAEVMTNNVPMLRLLKKMSFDTEMLCREGVYSLRIWFRK